MTHLYYAVLLISNRTTLTINAIGSSLLIVDQSSLIVTPLSLIVVNSYKHVLVYIYWSNVTRQSLILSTCDSSTSTTLVFVQELTTGSVHYTCGLHHTVLPLLCRAASILVLYHCLHCTYRATPCPPSIDPTLSCPPKDSLIVSHHSPLHAPATTESHATHAATPQNSGG